MTSKDDALKLALEALEAVRFTGDIVVVVTAEHGPVYLDRPIAAIREALAQSRSDEEQPAQQEPFGYFRYDLRLDAWVQNREGRPGTPFYTSPSASKQWQGLTDEEKSDLWCESTGRDCVNEDTHVFADAIEAKLREKNGF